MTTLCDRAELGRVTSGILHHLDSKMRGMPEDCLSEVWTMAHPQVEGLERASRISVSSHEGDGFPALDATVLDGRSTLFWLNGSHPRNAYKWTRGRGGPGSKDRCTPFLQHHGVKFTTLTVSKQVGWFESLVPVRFWQVDLITETILAVFQSAGWSHDLYARPDGGLWAVLWTHSKELLVEVWKPVLEPRPHKPIMMRRMVPTITQS
ncbi:hypothetical protein FOZ63_032708 [Perkinsus olseni]|uniref:Uncharacterized protein n=1 Tax=Perkinsus olseni TaxID=32597 RepID=A0A7J6R3C2_PEROL|nr:hypothetical protein FOZ63_032708 [Perkinsus olseni]